MKYFAWDPLALAAVAWLVAAGLYIWSDAARWFGFFVAAGLAFAVAGVLPLLALAHHPLSPGLSALVVIVGLAGGVLTFWFMVVKGHHRHPMLKRKGASGAAAQGGGGQGKKAPHHRAAVAFTLAVVFVFLAVSNWQAVWQTGRGGVSQTVSGFTQG